METKHERTSPMALVASGFFVALPLLLLGMLFWNVFQILLGWIRPILDAMPGKILHSDVVRSIAVIFVIALLLLLIGVLARTRAGRMTGRWLELALLSRLPFYNTLRSLASGLAGRDDTASLKAVLVTVDVPGLCQLGFIVERHADGYCTVFLPSSPNPGSGTVVVVEPARMRELSSSVPKVLQCLGRWGSGTAALLEKS